MQTLFEKYILNIVFYTVIMCSEVLPQSAQIGLNTWFTNNASSLCWINWFIFYDDKMTELAFIMKNINVFNFFKVIESSQ